ncbi:CDGSH iron-sulfur domain-containing protein [Mucilaginibacter sp. HD30]
MITKFSSLSAIKVAVQSVLDTLEQNQTGDFADIKIGLLNSVVRPLEAAIQKRPDIIKSASVNSVTQYESSEAGHLKDNLDSYLWQITLNATVYMAEHPDESELLEAVGALQRLSLRQADADASHERLLTLQTLQNGLTTRILTAHNGPYLVTNLSAFYNWLGEKLHEAPQMALCRCGASAIKPFCDGTHAVNNFTDSKDPNRVPDHRDAYVGLQVTVLDNRGICQHSGLCTDRLANVFRLGKEPFVAPSGGRMDEIIRAVRDCPSGALSYAIDGVEARDQVDHHHSREAEIEVTKDGPYRITGGIGLVHGDLAEVAKNEGSSYEHYALCRCGKSQNKPFCSGMHWYVGFNDPVEKEDAQPTIFEWAGGYPAFLRMTRLFYEKYVPQDDILAPLFAAMEGDHPERVAKWLAEIFCGPPDYSKEYGGYNRMLSQHISKQLTEEQRARWVKLLLQSAKDAMLPNDAEFRSAFGSYIEWGSRLAVENSQTHSTPPENMPMPHWDWNTSAGPPGSRTSALATPEEQNEILYPANGENISFEKHIKQLFRTKDRQSMSFIFDLWKAEDVKKYADEIHRRLENGSMPCDGAWEKEKLNLFLQWKETGMHN